MAKETDKTSPPPLSIAPRPIKNDGDDGRIEPKKEAKKPITQLCTSKVWKVPPRPKPGRKPQASNQNNHNHHTNGKAHRNGPISSSGTGAGVETELSKVRQELDQYKKMYHDLKGRENQKQETTPVSTPQHVSSKHASGDDCGLCDVDGGCVCDDLGLKQELKPTSNNNSNQSEPALSFENFERVDAVPLPKRKKYSGKMVRKYKRQEESAPVLPSVKELDFTSEFSKKSNGAIDSCGFCSKDTPCLCAETAKQAVEEQESSFIAGSCTSCQDDPMRTLFCSSLSAASSPQPPNSASISCSDTYQALSRHRNFGTADLGVLVSKLKIDSITNKVNVNSISNALKYLDQV